jgi:ectoine hydroxylase-related dioxygenase (phytanoyl-CoA dioxygenase family)
VSPLSPSQLASLDRDGYLVVAGALDGAWVERLRRAFEGAPAQDHATQHVEVTAETPEYAAWTALREHPVILAAAEHVLGRPFRVRDLHGRNPLPGFGQQGLHADWMPRASVEPYFAVTAIWMLDDFTRDNGATRLVPGSHRLLRPISKELGQPEAVHPSETAVTGAAGSVLVFNGHTWHSGRRNTSSGPRRAIQMVIVRDVEARTSAGSS